MSAKPLFHDLAESSKRRINDSFDQCIKEAHGEVFDRPIRGLSKDDILASQELRKLWCFWDRTYPVNFDGLSQYPEFFMARNEYAIGNLQLLVKTLWALAQLEEHEIIPQIRAIQKTKQKLKSSELGRLAGAIDHLREAAAILGYQDDHFYRQMHVTSIRKVEGESVEQTKIRRLAARAHRHIRRHDYPCSQKKQTSIRMYALRRIWPLLWIDVVSLKQLFLSENGVPHHSSALRSILIMASEDYRIPSSQIDNFIKTQE